MDKNTFIGILIINILFLFVPFYVNAKTVTGVGEFEFGSDITQNQSCSNANGTGWIEVQVSRSHLPAYWPSFVVQ